MVSVVSCLQYFQIGHDLSTEKGDQVSTLINQIAPEVIRNLNVLNSCAVRDCIDIWLTRDCLINKFAMQFEVILIIFTLF